MKMLTQIDPATLAARLAADETTLIDIREPEEFAQEHIAGAISIPLSSLDRRRVPIGPRGAIVFHCKSGMRTKANCDRLAAQVDGEAFVLEGGIEAWKKDGFGVSRSRP